MFAMNFNIDGTRAVGHSFSWEETVKYIYYIKTDDGTVLRSWAYTRLCNGQLNSDKNFNEFLADNTGYFYMMHHPLTTSCNSVCSGT